jgi:tetratricopeptide (TPR) repeat protein
MRPLALVLCCVLITPAPSARAQHRPSVEPVSDARIDRLERWLKAVARHRPGKADPESFDVGSWSQPDLQALWIDVDVLVKMMRNPGSLRFTMRMTGQRTPQDLQRTPQDIPYTTAQLRRLRALACAVVGVVADPHCLENNAATSLDEELRRVSALAAAARFRGDGDNYILRRGALLHADVGMLVVSTPVEPVTTRTYPPLGPQRFKMEISDGQQIDFGQAAVHWEIARLLLDYVMAGGAGGPAPGRDGMVRRWYRATAAWMQSVEDHDTVHLDHAREIFPTDPDMLFLSGAQHETYASSHIQSAVHSAVLPFGVSFALGSERAELRQAEGFFRRALEIKPDHGEARLRLGRVLGILGRHVDAARELRQALASVDDDLLRYYGELFVGAEEESLGQYDAAFDAYHRAAALYPTAQSPWLALSQLARRRGDRAAALRALQHVFDLPAEPDGDDPWWTYYVAQARNTDQLLEDLRRPFLEEHQP